MGSLCCLAVLVDVCCVFVVCAFHFKLTFLLVLLNLKFVLSCALSLMPVDFLVLAESSRGSVL